MIFIETLHGLTERIAFTVTLRYQHREGVRQFHPRPDKELQDIVERGAVAHARLDYRAYVLAHASEVVSLQDRLPRLDPQAVTPDSIDLAVVSDHPERLCEGPCRERVRGESRMHQCNRAGEIRVRQIRKILSQLKSGQHSFVNHRSGRKARNIASDLVLYGRIQDLAFDGFAH